MNLRIDLNEPKILEKVTSDKFGMLVSQTCKKEYDPFTPRDTSLLMTNFQLRPFEIWYKQPYAAIDYFNTRGVTFITQGTGRNPYATDHWDIKAAEAGKLNNVYRTLNSALQSGRI